MITTGEKVPNDRLKNQLNDLEVILHQLTVLDRADGPEQLNTAIDELLRCMGDYTHAERTYLFAYLSESGIYRNINEWCSKGVTPQIDNLQSVSYTDMPVWHETFLAGGMIIIPELSAVRQTTPAEYRLLVAQDIRTLTAFPLFRKTTLVGFIGLDNVSIERTSIFRIDLTTDTVYFISGSDALRREITPGGVPYARLTDSLDRVTAPEFAERAKQFRDLSTLPERLAQTDSVAFEYRTKGGDWHICRFFVKKRDENGRVTHVLYANRLTSDFILRERNWYVIAEEANRASAAKTDFLSRMAHDIRTPLNALLGFAEIAEQNVNDPERLRDALGKLTLSGRVLKQLVSDIFDVTQLESGQMRLSPENFDVEQLFRGIIEPFREDAERKRQTLVPVCREISCPTLYGDPTRLQQICVNLLSNAIRYTPAGGEIRCEFSEDIAHTSGDVLLRLVVRDNGVGISPDFLPHIFEKFSRSVDTRVNEVRGSGLGLAIVKELVEMMHGTIDIESTPGQGTTATVCIPFLRSEPDTTNAVLPCDGLHILVAEDNELSYEVAAELLGMYHIRTERAENGAICVERFLSTAPGTFDAILMDLQMPVMNGLDATRTIRGLGRADAAEIPIISMTANASPADMQSSLDVGMTRHLAKPLDIHQLLDALAACCKKPQENRQDPT